jgi:ArsR family transcriptional regulator, virulence genes transcriptional regulator
MDRPMKPMAFTSMADLASKSSDVANLLRDLANEKRLMILCALLDTKEASVADLATRVGLSQSALSQHLARLRERGVVAFRREGTTLFYHLSDPRIGRLLKSLKSIYC